MPYRGHSKLARKVAVAAFVGLTTLVAGQGAALASYGPPPPPVGPVPGGYYCVVTSRLVGPAGKTIGPIYVGLLQATIVIPAGAFRVPVQITITEPFGTGGCPAGTSIGNGGFPGYRAIGGLGIVAQVRGTNQRISYLKPLTLHLASPFIAASSLLVVRSGRRFVKVPGAVSPGSATASVYGNSDFALLVRGGRRHRHGRAPGWLRHRQVASSAPASLSAAQFVVAAGLWPASQRQSGLSILLPAPAGAVAASSATRLP